MKKVKKRLYRELLLWELMAYDLSQGITTASVNPFESYQKQMDILKLEKTLDFKEAPVFYDFKALVKALSDKSEEEILEHKNKIKEELSFTRELKRQISWTLQRAISTDDQSSLEKEHERLLKQEYVLLKEREQYKVKKNAQVDIALEEEEEEEEEVGVSVIDLCFDDLKENEELQAAWDDHAFWNQVQASFEQIARFKSAIDILIQFRSLNWKINRMSVVDRNILRIAVYELFFQSDIPPKVVINEAIDIGKKYGTQDSRKFINAILDKIALDLGRKK